MSSNQSSIIIYQSSDGTTKLDVKVEGDTVWLTQEQIAELYGKSRSTITEHLKNIFVEKELDESVVCRNSRRTTVHGAIKNKTQEVTVKLYNLDVIIAVGYRVKSPRGTQFRIWATEHLKEYIIKGFTMDDDRLKNLGGGSYWQELIARIRDIRASEKVFYRQILDIYSTSIDYDPKAKITLQFFKQVQNKIHYAVHGHTAAEVIYTRADAEKEFMGLTSFTGSEPGLKDALIAKNYLNIKELRALGQLVSGYLDFAERQAERQIPMKMSDWVKHLENILTSTNEKLLLDAGSISHKKAVAKAKLEYQKYQQKSLSEVEKAFLNSITLLEAKTNNV